MSAAEVFPDPTDPGRADGADSGSTDRGGPGDGLGSHDGNDDHGGAGGGNGGHLEWRISALIDDELSSAEAMAARTHLADCPVCQDEFAEVVSARDLIRDLGDVDPPSGFIDRLIARDRRRRRSRQMGIIGLLTLAGAWILLLIVGAGLALPSVEPPIADLAARHVVVTADGLAGVEAVGEPYTAPATVAGLDLVWVGRGQDGVHLLYRAEDGTAVSVFEQEGLLDWDALPEGGSEVRLAGRRAWLGPEAGGPAVAVVPGETFVYTIVGPGDSDATMAVAEALPDPPGFSLGDRVRRGLESVVERLGID